MVKLKPLGSKILVAPEKKQERTQNGLIIPVVVNRDLEEGTIIMVSPEVLHLKAGEKILYPATVGVQVLIDGETYKFLNGPIKDHPGDVIAVYDDIPIKANF